MDGGTDSRKICGRGRIFCRLPRLRGRRRQQWSRFLLSRLSRLSRSEKRHRRANRGGVAQLCALSAWLLLVGRVRREHGTHRLFEYDAGNPPAAQRQYVAERQTDGGTDRRPDFQRHLGPRVAGRALRSGGFSGEGVTRFPRREWRLRRSVRGGVYSVRLYGKRHRRNFVLGAFDDSLRLRLCENGERYYPFSRGRKFAEGMFRIYPSALLEG